MLNFCGFIQVFVFTRNHHLKATLSKEVSSVKDGSEIERCNTFI